MRRNLLPPLTRLSGSSTLFYPHCRKPTRFGAISSVIIGAVATLRVFLEAVFGREAGLEAAGVIFLDRWDCGESEGEGEEEEGEGAHRVVLSLEGY